MSKITRVYNPRKYFAATVFLNRRNKSSLGLWQEDINTEIKHKIEQHWARDIYHQEATHVDKKPHYVLPMFPYPSGNLHMGHVRVYSISDSLTRFYRLNSKHVVHPIGWDAFGLPAENAAIEHNIPPDSWTKSNILSMKKQLLSLGFDFDWNREISTCDSKYYKWTQYIFLQLFEKGLAYQNKALVNWDPVDKTVLADEQVDEFGCSWRSGAKVEKKILKQWFVRTTKFAQKLYEGLSSETLKNWKDIINLQKHWIGECNGVAVTFKLKSADEVKHIEVWSSEPYKFIHGQFVVISPKNVILEGFNANDLKCINTVTGNELPVFISDSASFADGREEYIACPSIDENDVNLANLLNFTTPGSNFKIDTESENRKAIEIATNKNVGGHLVSSKLKDWLISRQRYWGTPIPIIHCDNCGAVPVPFESLPVELPKMNTSESGLQSLAKMTDWIKCKCPQCKSDATRETDTMDTFVDSSWYYYRFLDPHNDKTLFDKQAVRDKMPVDIYVGGKEHAVLHLYYARFMSYFLKSLGLTPTEEPFSKLVVQGMVMGQSYKVKSSGKYLAPEKVEKVGKIYKEKDTGEIVTTQWEKMSKSKYNGENPERLLKEYGCDTTRLLILADVPPETSRNWSDATLPGVLNWQHRLWLTMREFLTHRSDESISKSAISEEVFNNHEDKIREVRNYITATATYHIKHTQKLSVAISRLQSLTSALRVKLPREVISKSKEFELALATLIIMISPVTPHFCAELWAGFLSAPGRLNENVHLINWQENILGQRWPVVDENYKLSFLCKVDGADRCDLKLEAKDLASLTEDKALQIMSDEKLVANRLRPGIQRTKFELYPGCRAILHIYTHKKVKPKKIQESVAQ